MTKQDALKILGLEEGANRQMIEARYERLIKGYGRSDPGKMEAVNAAYRLLTDSERQVKIDPKLQREVAGKSLYQWKNFFHYAKRPAIVGVIVLAIVISIIYSVATKTDPDFVLVAIGGFYSREDNIMEDTDELYTVKDFIKEHMDKIDPLVDVLTIGNNADPQVDMANMTKRILYAGGMTDSDVMLLDEDNFEVMHKEGVLIPLEEFYAYLQQEYTEEELAIIKPAYGHIYVSDEDKANEDKADEKTADAATESELDDWLSTELYMVGFDFSETQIFNGLSLIGAEQIIGVNLHNEDTDAAFEFIENLIKHQDKIMDLSPGILEPTPIPTPGLDETTSTSEN